MATAELPDDETASSLLLLHAEAAHGEMSALWDPHLSKDWDIEKPTEQCYLRIKRYQTLH